MFQVIWAIGVAMIVLALLVRLRKELIAGISLSLICFHNFLDPIEPEQLGSLSFLWKLLHEGYGYIPVQADWGILVAYPVIPWIGVMGIGFVFGQLVTCEKNIRNQWFLRLGISMILLFVLIRAHNQFGDAYQWMVRERGFLYTLLDFINTTKYPPSLQFLLMTLGPSLLLLVFLERQTKMTEVLRVFGKVPFFFYLIHVPIINGAAQIYHYFEYGYAFNLIMTKMEDWPESYEPSLALVYLVWVLLVILLYFPCRWFVGYKSRHRQKWWLKYV